MHHHHRLNLPKETDETHCLPQWQVYNHTQYRPYSHCFFFLSIVEWLKNHLDC